MDYSHLLDDDTQYNDNAVEPKSISVLDFVTIINAKLQSERHRIQGEVTSINKTYGKAIYFSIKDTEGDAKLDCMIWKNVYDSNGVDIEVGDEIMVTGIAEVYAPQGRLSLKASTIEYAGEGALKKAYDELKEKLTKEGILDRERRRLPKYPEKIGIITSLSGVVIHDFTTNLSQRGYDLQVINSRVEGKDALHEILQAIKTFTQKDIDVLVIMRGGGSWESLQAFNTESIVRAIAEFPVPVLTGIGHDVDVTLSELVADKGVSTPTAVAKTLNEPWTILENYLVQAEIKTIQRFEQTILSLRRGIQDGQQKIMRRYAETIYIQKNFLHDNLRSISQYFLGMYQKVVNLERMFNQSVSAMKYSLKQKQKLLTETWRVVKGKYRNEQKKLHQELLQKEKVLSLHNPENSLRRGYSLVYQDGVLVRSIKNLKKDTAITTRIADGIIISHITNIK